MAVLAAIFLVPIGVLFICSGLLVNLIQAILLIVVRPWSRNVYIKLNKVVVELLFLELIWLIDWWAGVKVNLYTDAETFKLLGKEHALALLNHRSDIDWLVGWVIAQRSGCLGSIVAIMKKSGMYLPVLGWAMWFAGYLFLERSWAKDEDTLKLGFKQLEDFPVPFWLAFYAEGTRFTQAKLRAAQEYATSRGLPVPRNVLVPRTKGFVSAVYHMRTFVPAIYDCTLAVATDQPAPTLLQIIRRQPSVVNFQIRRHLMQELPETDDGIAQWCRDVFVAKDNLLEKYQAKGTFSDLELHDLGRSKRSLFVVISWSCLIIFGFVKLFQYVSFSSSWELIAFSATFLVLVTIVMQILIQSSECERSTPAQVPSSESVKERLLEPNINVV